MTKFISQCLSTALSVASRLKLCPRNNKNQSNETEADARNTAARVSQQLTLAKENTTPASPASNPKTKQAIIKGTTSVPGIVCAKTVMFMVL